MPPKNASKGGGTQSKKTEAKKKEKVIEDKTFGIKNKKGAKQQRFIQQVQHQVKYGGNKSARELEKEKENQLKKKEDKKKELAEINALFKPVQQLAGKGTDPKSILCAFFKQGSCSKGAKCKFSHDLTIERKAEKRSAYVDVRDCEEETSADWDEAKLADVVEKKHGKEKGKPTTEIVCRYFLDAVENGKYGWFWDCPNGGDCIYRHALPPGFVLKKDRKKLEKGEEISLEDLIERERAALGVNTTKVTLETFLAWKKRKLKEKEDLKKKDSEKKKKDYNQGREMGLSGREMFTFNPTLATGGDELEEGDESMDVRNMDRDPEDVDDDSKYKEINVTDILSEYREAEESSGLSIANADRIQQLREDVANTAAVSNNTEDGANGEDEGAVGGASVDIDEDLFDGDDDDLEELEEELEDMTIA